MSRLVEQHPDLTIVYDELHRPIVNLFLDRETSDKKDPHANVQAVLDSGAHRTLLPIEIAAKLGFGSRMKRGHGIGVSGKRLRTHEAPVEVNAHVYARIGGQWDLWGPGFRFRPQFAKIDCGVLGRKDFFSLFLITFHERARLIRLRVDLVAGRDSSGPNVADVPP